MNKSGQMVIGFDMDGVVIDHTQSKIAAAKKLGYNVKPEQTSSLVLINLINGEDEYKELQKMIYDDEFFGLTPDLMPGVVDVLQKVQDKKIPFYLISKRIFHEVPVRLLERRGLWPKYFNEENVNFVDTKEAKNDVAIKCGVTHYIDDKISYLDVVTSVANRYLFDPHRVFVGHHNYQSLHTWQDFYRVLP